MVSEPMFRLAVLPALLFACLTPMTSDAHTVGAAAGAAGAATALQAADTAIAYTLRFPDAARHYVDVEASYPTGGARGSRSSPRPALRRRSRPGRTAGRSTPAAPHASPSAIASTAAR